MGRGRSPAAGNGNPLQDSCLKISRTMHVCVQSLTSVGLFVTLWTVAHQAPLFMGFSRQKHWSGLPFPSTGHLPHPGMEPASPESPALQADSKPLSHQGSPPVNHTQRQKDITPKYSPPPICPGQKVSNMLLGKSRGQLLTASERMKWLSQSRNDAQLWDVSGGKSKL